jgi:hypothetical protein
MLFFPFKDTIISTGLQAQLYTPGERGQPQSVVLINLFELFVRL